MAAVSSTTTLSLIESVLNDDSDSKFASIKPFYSSFDAYQLHLCTLTDSLDQLDLVSALINKFEVYPEEEGEEEFASFLTLNPILNPETAQNFISCELDEKAFIQEIIHNSNSFNSNWLKDNCTRISKAGSPFSVDELVQNLQTILSKNSANIQEEIFNLIGFEEFDFIEKVLSNREAILKSSASSCKKSEKLLVPGTKVTIKGKGEKLSKHYDSEWEIQKFKEEHEQFEQLHLSELKLYASTAQSFPHVYGDSKKDIMLGSKLSLPIGTDHIDKHTFEEFSIPYNNGSKTKKPEIELIKICNMEKFAQKAFIGYKNLNLMQSIVYETASRTNENMLVSAPTGAGKTDVAMLTVLKAIRDNLLSDPDDPGKVIISLESFKIVYVAPMKALATEIVSKFSKRLAPLGIKVREYTGDMQLTRHEIQETQIIVSTPEKWDVVTRKAQGDLDLVKLVTLLIIDEVHLLHDSRGPVLESIVARTLREVEVSQRMIRIVGLSATLPNYLDVAAFLRVNPYIGMFFFDDSFRPIPLTQHFIGVKGKKPAPVLAEMNKICFDRTVDFVTQGHQVMIFVHSRNETTKTARKMIEILVSERLGSKTFLPEIMSRDYESARKEVQRSRNADLKDLFSKGFGIHHAGMIRSDRLLVEKMFMEGHIKVLCCTATLAWGVNLPAHAVIIKGTQVYDSEKGEFTNLGILDVLQIFGRAGRPQFETRGVGLILTTHDKLFHYLNAIMCQNPIESQFIKMLPDNLNAEIALGTVSNRQEAVAWLGYTYLSVRMRRNPIAYGITAKEIATDPFLYSKMDSIISEVALKLRNCGMINFDNPEREGFMRIRNVGRLASLFYLKYETIEHFGKLMNPRMSEEDLMAMICSCSEFETIKVREDEMDDLQEFYDNAVMEVRGDPTSSAAKVSLLIQIYISRHEPASFSLQSDLNTIRQNAGRVFRAVFEIVRSQEWAQCAQRALKLCLCFERRVWTIEHPLAQFETIPRQVTKVLYDRGVMDMRVLLEEFDLLELSRVTGQSSKLAPLIRRTILQFPRISLEATCQPVLSTVLALKIKFCVDFLWDLKIHGGGAQVFWLWVEDETNLIMKHCESISTTHRQVGVPREINFYIAIDPDNPPAQLYIRAVSDRWLHASEVISTPLRYYSSFLLNDSKSLNLKSHTDLISTHPLPISALHDSALESLYSSRFLFFNAIQTQTFHALYHQSKSVLIGAPTGSGKTILAELAMWQALRTKPSHKIVYVAPLKALVRERLEDWKPRLSAVLGISVVELTGDMTPDAPVLQKASIILTTPEKWDGISRNWQTRKFVSQVSLVILDEIHLLGSDRGHVLEMIVTRMKKLSGNEDIRLVGLSTAMANAADLSEWLNGSDSVCYNFRPSVRPVPLQVYLEGYAGNHYCPRMASMNKPIYTHIATLSPDRPALVFVSSRRQTRLTAQALISLCVNDDQPHRFLFPGNSGSNEELQEQLNSLLDRVIDPIFKHTLSFGIAMHHAGMPESDRQIAEEAFASQIAQVLIATSTVAWGVNFPAHLVIVKGTEYYDAKIQGYRDLPVTDILQMIGRAGRPQFDTTAKAVILAQDSKKYFYKKFLYEPFPIESSLHQNFADHLNAEISTGIVKNQEGAVEFLKGTYLGVRLKRNPLFYGAEGKEPEFQEKYLKDLIEGSMKELIVSGCCVLKNNNDQRYEFTILGKIAAKYYLSHMTLRHFLSFLDPSTRGINQILRAISFASEFDSFPLRHNEDSELSSFVQENKQLIEDDVILSQAKLSALDYTKPHTKVYVLLKAHMLKIPLPVLDFETDHKIALEQVKRILAGLIELASKQFWLGILEDSIILGQLLHQKCYLNSEFLQIPNFSVEKGRRLLQENPKIKTISDLTATSKQNLISIFKSKLRMNGNEAESIAFWIKNDLPSFAIDFKVEKRSLFIFSIKIDIKVNNSDQNNTRVDNAALNDNFLFCFIGNEATSTLLTAPMRLRIPCAKKDKSFVLEIETELKEITLFCLNESFYGLDQKITIKL